MHRSLVCYIEGRGVKKLKGQRCQFGFEKAQGAKMNYSLTAKHFTILT
jgi:hypothetical protein